MYNKILQKVSKQSRWLPAKTAQSKTAPVHNGPIFGQNSPNFRLKWPHIKKSSVKTAPDRKVNDVLWEFSINLNDLTSL